MKNKFKIIVLLIIINGVLAHGGEEQAPAIDYTPIIITIIFIVISGFIFKKTRSKKKGFIIMIGLVLSSSVFVFSYNEYDRSIRNQEILKEIERISALPYKDFMYDNITTHDIENLIELTEYDIHIKGFMDEAAWLVEHEEPLHVGHALFFIKEYIRTGIDEICIPHELEHIKLYLEYGDYELAESQIMITSSYKDEWVLKTAKMYEKFPQFFSNYDELMSSVDEVLIRLNNKQYDDNETVRLLEYVEIYGIC